MRSRPPRSTNAQATVCPAVLRKTTPARALSTFCFIAGVFSILGSIGIFVGRWVPTLLILSNRFADKARPLPGLDPKLDEIAEKER